MQLSDVLSGIEVRERSAGVPAEIAGLHYDSRRIEPGWAFVAVRGEKVDGNAFVAQARARGASVIFSEATPEAGVAWVQVVDARAALALAAANWFQRPAERLKLVGITGTNGKTTTALLVEAMLRHAGWTTGLLGTIEYHVGTEVIPAPHTTPESYDLQQLLARMAAAGCTAVAMEVSSHALALERVWGCRFEVAVFTNLTQDHLDFHLTMANYREAKRRLFTGQGAPPPKIAVVNRDDEAAVAMTAGFAGRILTYGFGAGADIHASDLRNTPAGLQFTLAHPAGAPIAVRSPLLGRVNALNLMAAIGAGLGLGLDIETAARGAGTLTRVPGRFEPVVAGQPFTLVVDYAHTPDALANVLRLARELSVRDDRRGRVLVVFGCGGDRDRGKRPIMGRVAAEAADWVMVTSDNPRHEPPEAIIAEVLAGAVGGARVESTVDREEAIARAVAEARPGDVVVLAGKGHETEQIIGDHRRPFSDAAVAAQAIAARRGRTER